MKYGLPPKQPSFQPTTHSLVFHQNPSCPVSSHASSEISFQNAQLQRRSSASSLKDYVDIDKLIGDIKITPGKQMRQRERGTSVASVAQQPKPSKQAQSIATIYRELQILKENAIISDEVRTVELLMQSIQKKLQQGKTRQSTSRVGVAVAVSPIKQLWDDPTSRILYTNFSIKEMQAKDNGKVLSRDYDWPQASTPQKVSKFDGDQNQQVQKLNQQINALEKLLQMKTSVGNVSGSKVGGNPLGNQSGNQTGNQTGNPFLKQISTRPLSQIKSKNHSQSTTSSHALERSSKKNSFQVK